jgi:hypothetical protein
MRAKIVAITSLIVITGLWPVTMLGQSTREVPSKILLPWQTPGIDPDLVRQAQPALESALSELDRLWLGDSKTLDAALSPSPDRSLNMSRLLQTLRASVSAAPANTSPLVLQPVWCAIGTKNVVQMIITDLRNDAILASGHTTADRQFRGASILPPSLDTLRQGVSTALGRASQGLSSRLPSRAPSDAMRVGLSLSGENTSDRDGSSLCLSSLLAERLSGQNAVIASLGGENTTAARGALSMPPPRPRASRRIILGFEFPAVFPRREPLTFPLDLGVTMSWSESVLGQQIPWPESPARPHRATYKLQIASDARVEFPNDDTLAGFLASQKELLRGNSPPRVVRVYGAWVYVDKGRAWGLNINDRMISKTPDGLLLGHVVRFFGPELGLKDASGKRVTEGAILYVRKGQAEAKAGLVWEFDNRQFPTSWPPVPR